MRKILALLMVLLVVPSILAGCAGSKQTAPGEKRVVRFGIQYGLGYAPFVVAKEKGFVAKYLPGTEIQITQLAGGGAVREALLSNSIDVGGIAMPPIIQAWDKGTDLKIAAAISDMPVSLMTYRDDIKSLKDFGANDKIAVISLGSPQDIILKMASQQYLGNPKALDNHFVAMAHPEAMAALLVKKDIVAHFSAPPFIDQELKAGMRAILKSSDFPGGDFTFIIAATGKKFTEGNPKVYEAVLNGLRDASEWLQANPKDGAALLASQPNEKLTADDWYQQLTAPGVKFLHVPHGIADLVKFMHSVGLITKVPTFEEVTWKNIHGQGGN